MRNAAVALLLTVLPVAAESFHDNQEKQMRCGERESHGRHQQTCEIREQSMPVSGSLRVDASPNGGVTVKGWNRAEILVRSKLEAQAPTLDEAKSIASSVTVEAAGGSVRSHGPRTSGDRNWSVSFEVFVPHHTNLTAQTLNGGIALTDVTGVVHVETENGGLHLTRLAGDVKAITTNGGIDVALMGSHWDGPGLDVSSTNGGVHIAVPEHYSARLEGSTVNGGVHSDFAHPGEQHGHIQSFEETLGSGGPLVHAATVNGGVHISRGGEEDGGI